ncbi:MAG: translation initiation factor 2 [Chthoniobacterales bacterium]|nr:MAG: translation initiation factor 2 [Chthoniobacterales bacterium]
MKFKLMALFCGSVCLSSCATVMRGSHERLQVLSTPPGANVTLSSGETGVTPVSFTKLRRDSFQVTINKPGYLTQTVYVESRASGSGVAATAGSVALGGPIGVAVDAGTGAWNSLYPNPVSIQLAPAPLDPQAARKLRRSKYALGLPADQPGMLRSPYTQRLYDVRQVPHGTLVHDVDVDKLFINP